LRKQRKAQQLAKQREEEERQRQRQQQQGAAPRGSDSEEDGDGVHEVTNGLALQTEGDGMEQQGAAPAAYERLLGSLSSAGGAHATALQQRRREQAGNSDASSDEASEELGSAENDDADQEADASEDDGEEEESGEEGGEPSVGEEPSEEAAGGMAGGEGLALNDTEHAAGSDSDDEAGRSDAGADERQVERPAGPAAVEAEEDHYARHFDRCAGGRAGRAVQQTR
jgi:colicin import membrane protein